ERRRSTNTNDVDSTQKEDDSRLHLSSSIMLRRTTAMRSSHVGNGMHRKHHLHVSISLSFSVWRAHFSYFGAKSTWLLWTRVCPRWSMSSSGVHRR
ncbi:hypothetical protein KC19_10G162700, partial [Ceratodon purpureus]